MSPVDPLFNDDEIPGADSNAPGAPASTPLPDGRAWAEPLPQPPPTPPAAVAPPAHGVLLIGPGGTGKTLALSAFDDACAACPEGEPEIQFNPTNLAPLIRERRKGVLVRRSFVATGRPTNYYFSTTVTHLDDSGSEVSLGGVSYELFDGPGGALFPEEKDEEGGQSDDMKGFRRDLVLKGRAARALVILVNPINERAEMKISNNLPDLIQDMLVPTEIHAPSPQQQADSFFSSLFGRRKPAPRPPPSPPTMAHRFPFDRVLIMMNRFDQLCVEWKAAFKRQGHPDGELSPYEIAYKYSDPFNTATEIFGDKFLIKLLAQLKPGARLAVGVCSAGGFVRSSGNPFLDQNGTTNSMQTISPDWMVNELELFGLREMLLFAGYGLATPHIVEPVTLQMLRQRTGRG